MDSKRISELAEAIDQNLKWNFTWLANPEKNGIVFKYEPEAPILDKTGKPTGKTFGKLTTTILFKDGTKCTCSNSCHDRVGSVLVSKKNGVKLLQPILTADDDAKIAGIINCIFKRMIGSINSDNTINGAGGNRWLREQLADSYDQNIMDVYTKSLKKAQAAKNEQKHFEFAKKAHARKLKRMVREMSLVSEASELAAKKKAEKQQMPAGRKIRIDEDDQNHATKSCCKNNSKHESCCCKSSSSPSIKEEKETPMPKYIRPAKRFIDFTPEEKRAYWRAQKHGWL